MTGIDFRLINSDLSGSLTLCDFRDHDNLVFLFK